MCGIAGYIGTSKHPEKSYALMTALLKATEHRGLEATGYWSCSDGADASIQYYKEPVKATWFASRDMWKLNASKNPNLFLAHCRAPTKLGDERLNANNHPFVSLDAVTALIHNGKITEYNALKDGYELESSCDSEILLRIFEHGLYSDGMKKCFKSDDVVDNLSQQFYPEILNDLVGLWKLYSLVHHGSAFATAIGKWRPDNERVLWLFRNPDRPLHVVDLTESLGQFWFASTSNIFINAVEDCKKELGDLISDDQDVYEMPPMEPWLICLKSDGNMVYKRFKMAEYKSTQWYHEDKTKKLKKAGEPPVEVITAKFEEPKHLTNLELQIVINPLDTEIVTKTETNLSSAIVTEKDPIRRDVLTKLEGVKDTLSSLLDADDIQDEQWDGLISDLESAETLSEQLVS